MPARANRLGVWVKREQDLEPRMAALYDSSWFAEFPEFSKKLHTDWLIRENITKKYGKKVGISKIRILRKDTDTQIDIHSIRPANILGKDNQRLEELKTSLQKELNQPLRFNVVEASPNDAQIIAEKIATDLERRMPFRRAVKGAIAKAMAAHEVEGIKVKVSGRLQGAEIARTEWYLEGKVSLHTWFANIDNAFCEADTTYGKIGVQVIVNRTLAGETGKRKF